MLVSADEGDGEKTCRKKQEAGVWVKPRQSLPSERDPHSQQWSVGVAVLNVAHDRLQILSIAGTEGPVGLRQTRSLGREESLARMAEKWEGR